MAYLALTFFLVGSWALFAPRSFYTDFPGLGRAWVAADGPFNEHLLRDVGGLNLGLAVAATFALFAGRNAAVVVAFIALVYGIPHLIYHLDHLYLLPSAQDRYANVVALGLGILAPLLVLVPARANRGGMR